MANGRVTFMPPPQMRGVSAPPSDGDLLQQLAKRGGEGSQESTAMAAPLLQQGMMLLQQAAVLDPRIAPLIEKALEPLRGGKGAPELSRPRTRSNSNLSAEPGGKVPA